MPSTRPFGRWCAQIGTRGSGTGRKGWTWGVWADEEAKPTDPKETLEEILRESGTPRSSAIYRRITGRLGSGDPWLDLPLDLAAQRAPGKTEVVLGLEPLPQLGAGTEVAPQT